MIKGGLDTMAEDTTHTGGGNNRGRRSGFGNVRRLKSGNYQARYTGPDGRVHLAPVTFTTKGDAEKWLAISRANIVQSQWTAPVVAKTKVLTFGTYANSWLSKRELKPRTVDHYRRMLDRFLLPAFGDTRLTAIDPDAVAAWHATLDTGKTYRAHAYSLLRTIMRTAVDDRLIPVSPCVIRGAGAVKRSKEPKPATLDELEALYAAMPEQWRLMVLLGSWCALRYGELVELRRKDVDVKHHVLHVRRGATWVHGVVIIGPPKSDAGIRDVAIPPHLMPIVRVHLRDHAQWGANGLLFPSPKGNNLGNATFYEYWWEARKIAGRPDLRFHDLRHTGATLAAQTGATLAELMARLGHSTPAAAMRYQHAARGRDQEIAAALSRMAAPTKRS